MPKVLRRVVSAGKMPRWGNATSGSPPWAQHQARQIKRRQKLLARLPTPPTEI